MILSPWKKKFEHGFPLEQKGHRTVGREGEYPVVDTEGNAFDVSPVFENLKEDFAPSFEGEKNELLVGVECRDFMILREVGIGTIEIVSRPTESLFEIKEIFETAMTSILRSTNQLGAKVLGYGTQPVSPIEDKLMTPKQRYKVLRQVLGPLWNEFAVSASDQTHISVLRKEIIPLTNLFHKATPFLVGLFANSPCRESQDTGFTSSREEFKKKILMSENRHGMANREFSSLDDYLNHLSNMTCIFVNKKGSPTVVNKTFSSIQNTDFQDFLKHEHYVWNSTRPRSVHGTLEFRPICQQPWNRQMCATSFYVGLSENHQELTKLLNSVGNYKSIYLNSDQIIQTPFQIEIVPKHFWEDLYEISYKGLKSRSFGEEVLISPVQKDINSKTTPASRASLWFKEGGTKQLIKQLEIHI